MTLVEMIEALQKEAQVAANKIASTCFGRDGEFFPKKCYQIVRDALLAAALQSAVEEEAKWWRNYFPPNAKQYDKRIDEIRARGQKETA